MGRLADRFGRLPVLRVQVLVVILGPMAMLGSAAMGPTLFILGAAGFTLYPVAMAGACEKVERKASTGGHEPGVAAELHHRQPAGPT